MSKHVTISQLESALKKTRITVAELSEAIIEALEEVTETNTEAVENLSADKQTAGESVTLNSGEEIIFSTDYICTDNVLDSDEDTVLDSSENTIQSGTPIDKADEPNIIFDKETLTLIIDGKRFGLKFHSQGSIVLEAENVTTNGIKAADISADSIILNGISIEEKIVELEDNTALNTLSEETSKKQTAGESVTLNSGEEIIFSTDYAYTDSILDSEGEEILDSDEEVIQSSTPIDKADEPNIIFDKETLTLIIDGKQFELKFHSQGNIVLEAENVTADSITVNGINIGEEISTLKTTISALEERISALEERILTSE